MPLVFCVSHTKKLPLAVDLVPVTRSGCEGGADITYRIVYEPRLNAKEEIRMLNGASSYVTRDAYDKSGKTKLRDLYGLKWKDNSLYAVSVAGQAPILAVSGSVLSRCLTISSL